MNTTQNATDVSVDEMIAEAERLVRLPITGPQTDTDVRALLSAACDSAVLGEEPHSKAVWETLYGPSTKRRARRIRRRGKALLAKEAKDLAGGKRGTYPPGAVTAAQRDDHDCRYAVALLEQAGEPYGATKINDTALARRRVLTNGKAAVRPSVEAVQRAVLHQIAREQAIRLHGGRAICMTGPFDEAHLKAEQWIGAVDGPVAAETLPQPGVVR